MQPQLTKQANAFKLLGNPLVLQTMQVLSSQKECNQTHIVQATNIEQTYLSHYLGKMVEHGLINARKDGRNRLYSISPDISIIFETTGSVIVSV